MAGMMQRLSRGTKRAGNAVVGTIAIGLIQLLRLINPDIMANVAGSFMRRIGPLLRENRIGRANLTAAFPEKSPAEIDTILRGVWDNVGRVAAEFAHLDHLSDFDPWHPERPARIEAPAADIKRFLGMMEDGKPALVFGAHYANWELPAVCAAACNVDTAVLYRRPNIRAIDKWLHTTRTANMGKLISTGRAYRHAGRPVLCARGRCHFLWPPHEGQSPAGTPCPSLRLPDPRHPRCAPAEPSISRRID
jgi:KDO2-lipid IV(A) lauroyltransferase